MKPDRMLFAAGGVVLLVALVLVLGEFFGFGAIVLLAGALFGLGFVAAAVQRVREWRAPAKE